MGSPFAADASTASLDSTTDDIIDIRKTPAVISWTNENDGPQSLSHDDSTHEHITLDLHFNADSNTALFKITANVAYKGKRNKSNVFLVIFPERVQTLAVDDHDEIAPAKLGTSVYSLHFTLSSPPRLLVPKGDWVPKNEAARSTLALLQDLAKNTHFHIAFPSRTLGLDRLAALCKNASVDGRLKTPPNSTDVSRLYGGKGGVTIENGQNVPGRTFSVGGPSNASLAAKAADSAGVYTKSALDERPSAESPPSYDELDAPLAHPSSVRKRRRLDSDPAAGTSKSEEMSLEDICRHGFREMGRRFDRIEQALGDLNSRLDRVEQIVLKSRPDEPSLSGQEDQHSESIGSRVDCIEERVAEVEQRLDVGLSELAKDVENQICDLNNEFNDTITVRVEDEMYVVQSQLQEFVKDEVHDVALDVEEIVRERFRDALA